MLRSNEEGNRDAGGKPRAKQKQQRTVVWCGTEEERQEIREEPMRGQTARSLSLAQITLLHTGGLVQLCSRLGNRRRVWVTRHNLPVQSDSVTHPPAVDG
jgi:hypothetical protein